MEITLKEYLIKFFNVGESFFDDGISCDVDFKGGTLGFVTNNILKKISFGKSFVPLEKVFPAKKKIQLSFSSHPFECRVQDFSSPSGTFKEAILKFDRFELDLKHDETPEDDFDIQKLLKKNKLRMLKTDYMLLNRAFGDWHEVFFHHDYEASPIKMVNTYNLSRKNHFLIKKGKEIFYIHTEALNRPGWIGIKI